MAVINIPDNATNGDVIKAIFTNGITIDRSTAYAKQVTEEWLNAPYTEADEFHGKHCPVQPTIPPMPKPYSERKVGE